ncbi:MAG: septum formation initiator family protein [Pseudomonadota bacterium]
MLVEAKAVHDRPNIGLTLYFAISFIAILYFAFAAIRGELGVIERLSIAAQTEHLNTEKENLALEIAALENKTYRLSDGFLDLDLLDERARDILGYLRADDLILD